MTDHPATSANPAIAALEDSGIDFTLTRQGKVRSLEEAAAGLGIAPAQIIKTMVVRRSEGAYVFVLVPGGRQISWPKLRAHLGQSRLSLPDADGAKAVTGFERGTITPFGSTMPWPVIADVQVASAANQVSIGAGAHGVAAMVEPAALIDALQAEVVDVTDPEPSNPAA